jgi:hypothetical protein
MSTKRGSAFSSGRPTRSHQTSQNRWVWHISMPQPSWVFTRCEGLIDGWAPRGGRPTWWPSFIAHTAG